jgi:hypothetical protein
VLWEASRLSWVDGCKRGKTDQTVSPGSVLANGRGASSESVRLEENPPTSGRSIQIERLIHFALRPPVILVVLVALLASRGITQGEFFYYGDEMRHAMNGVFFRDFMSDLPLHHPLQYLYEYYAKYPALAFPHWPPLFHFIEGVFFLLFGLSPNKPGSEILFPRSPSLKSPPLQG